jgi:hypothetical protein
MEKDIHGAMGGPEHSPGVDAHGHRPSPEPANLPRNARQTAGYTVIIDLPDLLPVTEGELELLESELADFIAELLKT